MKTPVIKVSNLTEEEFNILCDTCKREIDKNNLTQFYLTPLNSELCVSTCDQIFDTEIECLSYSEFMKLYKECSLEHIL